jgi:hypothetical protein
MESRSKAIKRELAEIRSATTLDEIKQANRRFLEAHGTPEEKRVANFLNRNNPDWIPLT